ncbi:MAG: SMC-Scp complex subunit ScpB [Clostridiales Family XIII bacterium]|jgi:segregation and condensation protein B|nr:SMC-Scp complex subunit ScpB [Clostridiales Family XIII bacterium]
MDNQIKSVIETLLFLEGDPISPNLICKIFDIKKDDAKALFLELKKEYEEKNGGIKIRQIKDSFQFVSNEENYDFVKPILFPEKEKTLSNAALEALSIIAYKGPITKPAIDNIRGIKSDRLVFALLEKGLIEEAGKSDAIGKPMTYKTTDLFLEYLNIKDLSELPPFLDDDADILKESGTNITNLNQLELDI